VKTVKLYWLPKSALRWRKDDVALHNPRDPAALIAAVESVFGKAAGSGDRIKVLDGNLQIVAPFTVS
jgi:hypothetical protein